MEALSLEQLKASTMAAVRAAPEDASARMQLFRLFVLTGQWARASVQLETASQLDAGLGFSAMVWQQAVACERFRSEVFAGRRTPVIAGEPPRWLALMVEALRGGHASVSLPKVLRAEALEQAQPVRGRLDGGPFEWIADADERLGPVLECFIDGKYYWVPFDRIERIELAAPEDMLDLAWMSAEIRFASGGSKHVLLPVRYPGTEASADEALILARRTVWEGDDARGYCGLGQRVLVTDALEVGLLDVRVIEIG